jgi:hypothetical protein
MIGDVELHYAAADCLEALRLGVDDDAFGDRRRAGSRRAVAALSFGICVPISIAARMIEVPSGTVILAPSMVSVTVFSDREAGVP